jgi:hypothetical protein
MASRAEVAKIVEPLLQALPVNPGLPDLQQFYRAFIFEVGYYILGQFPGAALGTQTGVGRAPGNPGPLPGGPVAYGSGPGKGIQPGAFATLVLGLPWDAT